MIASKHYTPISVEEPITVHAHTPRDGRGVGLYVIDREKGVSTRTKYLSSKEAALLALVLIAEYGMDVNIEPPKARQISVVLPEHEQVVY